MNEVLKGLTQKRMTYIEETLILNESIKEVLEYLKNNYLGKKTNQYKKINEDLQQQFKTPLRNVMYTKQETKYKNITHTPQLTISFYHNKENREGFSLYIESDTFEEQTLTFTNKIATFKLTTFEDIYNNYAKLSETLLNSLDLFNEFDRSNLTYMEKKEIKDLCCQQKLKLGSLSFWK